jgi:hypothetical protein
MNILHFLQTYQTVVVGFIGFSGVIITLVTNAKISQIAIERMESRRAKNISVAVQAEISMIRDLMQLLVETDFRVDEGGSVVIPLESNDEIFRSQLSNIGALSLDELRAIARVYSEYASFQNKLILAGKKIEKNPFYIELDVKQLPNIKVLAEAVSKLAGEAASRLSKSNNG